MKKLTIILIMSLIAFSNESFSQKTGFIIRSFVSGEKVSTNVEGVVIISKNSFKLFFVDHDTKEIIQYKSRLGKVVKKYGDNLFVISKDGKCGITPVHNKRDELAGIYVIDFEKKTMYYFSRETIKSSVKQSNT